MTIFRLRRRRLSCYPHRSWITALWVLALGSVLSADDWPQWRGPTRDGVWHEQGILESFPTDGLKVLWRAEAGGGWSSPVVAAGRVYLHDSELTTPPQARERVRCFEEATGKLLWTYRYEVDYPDWAFGADQNGGPVATPSVVDGKVYTVGANGEIHCLDAATGEVLWRRALGKEYHLDAFKCGRASPLIDGDRVIVFVGGKPDASLLALDRHTGRDVWKALNEEVANSTPILLTIGGRRQLIVWTGESVSSLDPATGAPLWREPMTTSNNDGNATPVAQSNRLLISGLMFQLSGDAPAAKVLWPVNRGVAKRVLSNTSTPLLAGDFVYSATSAGGLVCLDARTGERVWTTDKITARKTGASIHLTLQGDGVFLYTDEGNLIRARLTPAGYEELGRTRVIEPVYKFGGHKLVWAPPAYANRRVFVRNERELLCASLSRDGQP